MIWIEMSYHKYDFTNKNRLIEEEYNEELDKNFNDRYEIDMNIDWEE